MIESLFFRWCSISEV